MLKYDVLIVGGGPGGGECARSLSMLGKKVALVERQPTFNKNNFSSAASIIEILSDFNLPESVVGAYWNKFAIHTLGFSHTWEKDERVGVVLDFAKLRNFLASECERYGGKVYLNYRYEGYENAKEGLIVTFTNLQSKQQEKITADYLVDATGPKRAVICPDYIKTKSHVLGVGCEWLIEVEGEKYSPEKLEFFLGNYWAPNGYSWIFPMNSNQLKVGACFLWKKPKISLNICIKKIIDEFLKTDKFRLVDQHGGVCRYTKNQQDIFVEGRIIGVGDAISAINPLGGEGIRHAMHSGRIAAQFISKAIDKGTSELIQYEKEMRRYFGSKWLQSERLSNLVYRWTPDFLMKTLVKSSAPRYQTLDKLKEKLFCRGYDQAAASEQSYLDELLKDRAFTADEAVTELQLK